MKQIKSKIVGSLLGVAIASLAIFNLNMVFSSSTQPFAGLAFSQIMALSAELPEIIIECGQEFGKCWEEDCHTENTPFGPTRVTYCPTFTGLQRDICIPEMPCWT